MRKVKMKISNYAISKIEEMRRNNDEIENNREECELYMNSVPLSESDVIKLQALEKMLRDKKGKEK